ncbi:hypothetical protein BAS10_13020 [Elizabethkingia meningoseptica]|uniref:hypothetical protein n=1 Tax=Elizabethkingia meningoseptica TaxID=238 RepID=UPI00099936CB|nr:hypothetical protein [Elizabethkingia meningoseptica]OPB93721.1 hypothetical protein BAS10_13020 [Elizabethkingia meningoseptica]
MKKNRLKKIKEASHDRTGMSLFLNRQNFKDQVFFKLTELDGDQGIWLGQSILALIAINKSPAYSEEMNHGFIEDLFASLIQELNITPEDLRRVIDQRKEWETEDEA